MPPQLALILTVGFILFLFRREARQKPNVTSALWIPLTWMMVIGSRYASQWLSMFGLPVGGISLEDGSPVDAMLFLILIISAAYVLWRRRVNLAEVVANNGWLSVFFAFCFISILWSDFPFVAFKRWIKVLGHPMMVLVLLTEPNPREALVTMMKRCAYVLIPASVLLIKYYPQYGRGFSQWTGAGFNTGVTTNKNELGYLCLVLGFFFFWRLLDLWGQARTKHRKDELILTWGFLGMIWWLLYNANSKTPLISLIIGMAVAFIVGLRWFPRQVIGVWLSLAAITLVFAQMSFGIYEAALKAAGRDITLTDRTYVWKDAVALQPNPILGAGFESFWLGERREKMWEKYNWRPNQAHNGYIETYLNVGAAGLLVLGCLLFATFRKARAELLRDVNYGRFRMGFLLSVLVYNWTEASFKALHLVWFVFYIIAIDLRRAPETATSQEPEKLLDEDRGLDYARA